MAKRCVTLDNMFFTALTTDTYAAQQPPISNSRQNPMPTALPITRTGRTPVGTLCHVDNLSLLVT